MIGISQKCQLHWALKEQTQRQLFYDLTGSQEWKLCWVTQLCQHQIFAHIVTQKCRCPWDVSSKNCTLMDLPKPSSSTRNFTTLWCQRGCGVSSSGSDSVTNKGLSSNNGLCPLSKCSQVYWQVTQHFQSIREKQLPPYLFLHYCT